MDNREILRASTHNIINSSKGSSRVILPHHSNHNSKVNHNSSSRDNLLHNSSKGNPNNSNSKHNLLSSSFKDSPKGNLNNSSRVSLNSSSRDNRSNKFISRDRDIHSSTGES